MGEGLQEVNVRGAHRTPFCGECGRPRDWPAVESSYERGRGHADGLCTFCVPLNAPQVACGIAHGLVARLIGTPMPFPASPHPPLSFLMGTSFAHCYGQECR